MLMASAAAGVCCAVSITNLSPLCGYFLMPRRRETLSVFSIFFPPTNPSIFVFVRFSASFKGALWKKFKLRHICLFYD